MSPDRIRPGSAGSADSPEDEPLNGVVANGQHGSLDDDQLRTTRGEGADPVVPTTSNGPQSDETNEPARENSRRRRRTPAASVELPNAVDLPNEEVPLAVPRQQPTAQPHRGLFRRVYYGETRIDFVRRRRIWFMISSVVILAGVISLATRGLNLGIEFVGGTSWTVSSRTLTISTAEKAISSTVPNPVITILGTNSTGSRQVQVEAKLPKGQGAAQQTELANKVQSELATLIHGSINDVSVESVGPSWGGQITQKAIEALIVFFILIALYISIFFEWRMAIAAIIAVAHDVLVTVGIYSLSGFEVTPDTVVAFLTILGYSLYDTIVVFDRIRDNVKNLSVRDRMTFTDVVNLSMNQTLARSINTSLVAIMPILAVLVLGAEFLGASTLQYFGLALLVGLTTGAYSSIFIASPLVALMKEREPRYRQLRERLIARGGDRWLLSASEVASGVFGEFANVNGATGRPRRDAAAGRIRAGTATTNGSRVADVESDSSPDADATHDAALPVADSDVPSGSSSDGACPPTWRTTLIDIQAARREPERFRAAIARKGALEAFDALLAIDRQWRDATAAVDQIRSEMRPKGRPSEEERAALVAKREELRTAQQALDELAQQRTQLLLAVPNPPDDGVPDGDSEDDAVEVKRVGEVANFPFEPLDHLALGGFDMERGARLSGSRFAYRIGPAALVELSLYRFALDRLVGRGFVPVLPPVLVREEAMIGTGFLPTDEANLYRVEPDGLYLTGTSEVALAAMHEGEILEVEDLPLRYTGYSTNFRREAGAAGRDTRGIFRVHQFDKVEMFVFTTPERSAEEHEAILDIEEQLVQELGLAYRVVNTAAGDLGAPAARKYDIEAWIPTQGRYREITSCSNTTDYQARRLGTRYREGNGLRHPHTLNGTAMTARFLVAILETFQDAGGGVAIPAVLVPFGAPAHLPAPTSSRR